VIAATGSWERSPFWDPAAPAHRDSDLLAFKAHFSNCRLASDLMPLLVFPGGYGGMVHSDMGRVSLSCCIRRDALRKCRHGRSERAGEIVLEHIRESCRAVRTILADARVEGPVLSAGPIRPGPRAFYRDGIFFVGNCAGEAHPIIAEGISMAMQSAWLLCRQLIGNTSPGRLDDVGRAYAFEWRRHFAFRTCAAALFAGAALTPASHAILRPLLKWQPGLLALGARLSGKAHRLPGIGLYPVGATSNTLFTT